MDNFGVERSDVQPGRKPGSAGVSPVSCWTGKPDAPAGRQRSQASRKSSRTMAAAVAQLCPQCALCCNGVLFKDVELQPGDSAAKLKMLGLPVSGKRVAKFPQPCAALDGGSCRIYGEHPARCREFECALLKSVAAGETDVRAALRVIRDAQKRVEKVRRLLSASGDVDESLALSLRFKRTQRRMESASLSEAAADTFGELTLAVHDLNLLLRMKFYPSPGD